MILLTSLSPRRKELLQQIGFNPVTLARRREVQVSFSVSDFIQIDSPVNFNYHQEKQDLTLDEVKKMTVDVAKLKIHRVVEGRILTIYNLQPEKTVVVGADTIVYFNNRVLDRPSLVDLDLLTLEHLEQAEREARRMLSSLRGQTFHVITGLALACGENLQQDKSCYVMTEVKMKEFSDEDIERYIGTKEPLDKTGAFGIQERGVVLFEEIKGSYTNVVGLPLVELVDLLGDPIFRGRVQLPLSTIHPVPNFPTTPAAPELRVVAVGDINYDLRFNELPAGFFPRLSPPGKHVRGELKQAVGGSAVIFAHRAREAGFKQCSVLGAIGGDALGKLVEEYLSRENIQTLLPANYNLKTSIALILRDQAENDTSLTITHAQQSLSEDDISKAKFDIEKALVVFVSGYCLTDPGRQRATLKVMEWAREANQIVVLDATVNIDEAFDFITFTEMIHNKVDVLVAEIQTILNWLNIKDHLEHDWSFIIEHVIPILRQHFPVIFLRTSTYSHEFIITPRHVPPPIELDYSRRSADKKLGYADERTAHHLYRFMSSRLLMASSSPRRVALLRQIIADTKFEVLASEHTETYYSDEAPKDRVRRLAIEKARMVLSKRDDFSPSIEIVIGADTEIVLDGVALGKSNDAETAREILRKLSGRSHEAITGLALINIKTGQEVVDCVSTQVDFKQLSQQEIENYILSGEPIGKAGAYGIQGIGVLFVKGIVGSYSNVMGLPLECLSEILKQDFKMPVWDIDKVSSWNF